MRRAALTTPTGMAWLTVVSCSTAAYATRASRLCSSANAAHPNALIVARRETPQALSPERHGHVGTGGSSPALLRPTRVTRIPPQLARLMIAVSAALLQVFVAAYQRESRKLSQEERARDAVGGAQGSTTMWSARAMSAMEAMQVLGLDRGFPELYTSVQQAEANAMQTSTSLPLPHGKAREAAQQNFERMFALAVKEENMFLAGKLSAAYRICVDPAWDQATPGENEKTVDANPRSAAEPDASGPGRSF
ncbi:hypothetical protein GH5_01008 [Leishmania sp. Ghana 2012 LV757]|uniref:hypothetical protein n=1 Tax=Leishmania sp. Ghana 2012 LV757 TaxID=2803181 RepID=UPI001B66155D|nr:hypothetical protein GH5_01008 [Leishmania sp. Ghana 2012 LV757]